MTTNCSVSNHQGSCARQAMRKNLWRDESAVKVCLVGSAWHPILVELQAIASGPEENRLTLAAKYLLHINDVMHKSLLQAADIILPLPCEIY